MKTQQLCLNGCLNFGRRFYSSSPTFGRDQLADYSADDVWMSPADYALGRQGAQINDRMALIHSGADKGFVGPVVVGLLNQGLIRLLPR